MLQEESGDGVEEWVAYFGVSHNGMGESCSGLKQKQRVYLSKGFAKPALDNGQNHNLSREIETHTAQKGVRKDYRWDEDKYKTGAQSQEFASWKRRQSMNRSGPMRSYWDWNPTIR